MTWGTSKPAYLNLQENLESTKVGKCGEVAAAEFGIPLCSHLRFGWASCQSHLLIRNTSPPLARWTGKISLLRFLFFGDLEGGRAVIGDLKLHLFFYSKNIFCELMMHVLLSMSAKYCAEKKAFCSNTLGGPFIPIWHLLAIPNNTKWIHSPFCLLWSSS